MPGVPTIHVLPDEGMSFSKQVTIFCDRCGQWEQFSHTTVAEMRRELRQRGWRAVALNPDAAKHPLGDVCPECVGSKKEES